MPVDAAFDILVVGAGGCGLTAAIAAKALQPDIQVAVLEKADRLMGNTMLSSGSIPAANTRFQRAAGVQDNPEIMMEDLFGVSGAHEATDITRQLAFISAELIEWLVDVAHVEMTLVETYKHIGHRVHRLHSPPSRKGADLMHDLHKTAQAMEIPIVYDNAVTQLLVSSDGAVAGVMAQTPDDVVTSLGARSVILATNGFGANRDLLTQFCPEISKAPYAGSPGSQGEAIIWGMQLGAAVANMGAYQAHASLADPHGSLVTWTVIEKGGIIVDAQGRRFGNETMGYSAFAEVELAHQGPFYMISDRNIRDVTASGQPEYAELCANGGVIQAEDVQALAKRLAMNESALSATITQAMACARTGQPDPFGRVSWGLGPLQAPLCVTRITPAMFHTQGGLRVDEHAHVLRHDGSQIKGLYAGGGAAAGISGFKGAAGYVSGNGLLTALGLGYLAGRSSARELS
ncbi:MAG: FAD-dependent oxidoreductase [Limnohabitans sp.]